MILGSENRFPRGLAPLHQADLSSPSARVTQLQINSEDHFGGAAPWTTSRASACLNSECPDHGKRDAGNLTMTSRYGPGKVRRMLCCRTCEARFFERKRERTPLFDLGCCPGRSNRPWGMSPKAAASTRAASFAR